ncbi:MAG TPA: dienelactone hydrolase family protein, partial [Planctomycetota bacterium]|nr:dienelactone hydrolase family protein [Planctomycetota bacterium]
MTEDPKTPSRPDGPVRELARRDFVVLSMAAGLAATARPAAAAARDIVETDVEIKTPDGTCDAAFIRPQSGAHPGVLLWPDAFGLRPSMRDMAKRLAKEGYSVLVPNPYYRVTKAPYSDASHFDFKNESDMAKLKSLMAGVNAPGNPAK